MGPIWFATSTGLTQPWPLHWYQALVEADCTHVRGGTFVPSVADAHHAYVAAQPAVELIAFHVPFAHEYHAPSVADCTHVPAATSRSSVADEQVVAAGGSIVPPPPPPPLSPPDWQMPTGVDVDTSVTVTTR